MNRGKSLVATAAFIGSSMFGGAALAQGSTIVYFNMRGSDNNFYTTTPCDFVGGSTLLSTSSTTNATFAMDTANGVDLYMVEWGGGATGFPQIINHLDIPTGTVTEVVGFLDGPTIDTNISGLSYNSANGLWYLVSLEAAGPTLFEGDIVTGVFTEVGLIGTTSMIDISINEAGECYGHNHADDMLYEIDLTTALPTLIGPTGWPANFAQGMDFDPCDGKLYATIYTGGGTGQFVEFDLTTGAGVAIQETTPLNAEMEMVVLPGDKCGCPSGICPDSSTVLAGVEQSGSSADICDEDGSLWVIQSTTFDAAFSPPPTAVQFDGNVNPVGGTDLTLRLVGGAEFGSNTAFIQLRMWNYTTGAYVGMPFINQPDSTNTVYEVTRAVADYVGPNGEVQAEITAAKTVAGPIRLRMDQVAWEVN